MCQSSLFNSTTALQALWSQYQLTVHSVARLHSERASLDMIQSQVDAMYQSLVADNQSSTLYSAWSHLIGQLPRINNSLLAISTQVFTQLMLPNNI